MNKTIMLLIGFGAFILGGVSLVLELIGVRLKFLGWLDDSTQGWTVLIYLFMIIIGISLAYVAMMRDPESMSNTESQDS